MHTIRRIAAAHMSLLASMLALPHDASGELLTVWRGETLAVRLQDEIETPFAGPAGISLRFGALKTVKYALGHQWQETALQYGLAADRVDWSCNGDGQRIVEISVPPDFPAGDYALGGQMRLKVLDRVLPPPAEWKYFLDIWQHPWAVARVAGAKPFSPEHYKAMRPLWELLATAGQKTLTVTLVDQPWNHQCRDAYGSMVRRIRMNDGSWRFDYALFDAYVEFGLKCGLGPLISCYTMCPWNYIVSWEDESGALQKAEAKPGSSFFETYWGPFLEDFAAHLKEKGWYGQTVIAMDERIPEDVKVIADFVRQRAPGLKLGAAGNRPPGRFSGIKIDFYSQGLSEVSDELLAEVPARRAQGLMTTHYICCGPATPNTFVDSHDGEAFWAAFYPAACGLDGMLRWAWNSWGNDAMSDASFGHWRAGDTYLAYPDGSPSWRFLELRNGIVAAEKFRLLKESGVRPVALEYLSRRFVLKDALAGKTQWQTLRKAVQEEVNRPYGNRTFTFAGWNLCARTFKFDTAIRQTWRIFEFLDDLRADVLGVTGCESAMLRDSIRNTVEDPFRTYPLKFAGTAKDGSSNAHFVTGYEILDAPVRQFDADGVVCLATRLRIDTEDVVFFQCDFDGTVWGEAFSDVHRKSLERMVDVFSNDRHVVLSGNIPGVVRNAFRAAGFADDCLLVKGLRIDALKLHERSDITPQPLVFAVLTLDGP